MTAVRNNGQFIPLNNASHAIIIHLWLTTTAAVKNAADTGRH